MTSSHSSGRLQGSGIQVGYDQRVIIDELDVTVPDGSFTVIIGPNACGKSTLLRALSRLMKTTAGSVLLDGRDVHQYNGKAFAREIGLLPQQSLAPDGITVVDLVSRGRFPYQTLFKQWTDDDESAVRAALRETQLLELATRPVQSLSGGQRQRVWIAMALAQETEVLLLDEPTTYLDLAHQLEVLDLLTDLNRRRGTTIVMVLHDINLAARYSDQLVTMHQGRLHRQGPPAEVITPATMSEVFGVTARVHPDPVSGTPLVMPVGRHHTGENLAAAS